MFFTLLRVVVISRYLLPLEGGELLEKLLKVGIFLSFLLVLNLWLGTLSLGNGSNVTDL